MGLWLGIFGRIGGILALVALIALLVEKLIVFVGFLAFAIKAIIVLAFVLVFCVVGYLALKTLRESRKRSDKSHFTLPFTLGFLISLKAPRLRLGPSICSHLSSKGLLRAFWN